MVHNFFLSVFIFFNLYMFRAVWYAGWNSTLHTSHPYRITSTKCCLNTVASPDDGHIAARNM